ncbi:hypothetical protein BGX33_009674, partial [Mortierella sp. NVP41]
MVQHLDKADFSRLSRTSRRLHLWIDPLMYKDLTAWYYPAVYLHNCIRAFELGLSPVSSVLPMTAFHVVPIPPMTKLTELDLTLGRSFDNSSCPYFMSVLDVDTMGFEQSCKVLQLSEHLVKVMI